ncbi:MAG TPA: hypothetical protein DCO79_01760 [Spirochaeta sp.]|nr:hypothetical protein [Spirochaeta sp.]
MTEYDLDIDDVRWYKSWMTSQELLSYAENQDELVQIIWSGNLASRLYNMEEEYLGELQSQIDRGITDETGIREILSDAYALKNKRSWNE